MEHFGLSHILFEPDKYSPDTLDLLKDEEAREYWLNTCEKLVEKYVNFALTNNDDQTVEIRALKFKTCYVEAIKELRVNPLAHGQLTIRLLLDINETCLRSQGFFDLWKQQKKYENDTALASLRERLNEIDALQSESQRWTEICRGVLAGNMFDWGAQAVTDILDCGLYGALQKIQTRPWLYDGLDKWLEKLELKDDWQRIKKAGHKFQPISAQSSRRKETKTVHHCAAVFVDNSGVDIVLGILPFIRALLLRGTSVILCANEWPALNDITNVELEEVLRNASLICPVLSSAMASGDLVVRSSGQRGPCLDLRTISVVNTARFDLLAEYMTSTSVLHALKEIRCKNINSDVDPEDYEKEDLRPDLYSFKDSILEDIDNTHSVINHAGANSYLEVLEGRKPLLVVINEDLMNNHQLELAEQLQVDGHFCGNYCTCDILGKTSICVLHFTNPNCLLLFVKCLYYFFPFIFI